MDNQQVNASHFEAYACAITKQKIGSKDLIHRREKLYQQPSTTDNKCWLCKKETEDVTHILSSCSKISYRYYLPLRHDVIAKYAYKKIRKKINPDCKLLHNENQFIEKEGTWLTDMVPWYKNLWNSWIQLPSRCERDKKDTIKRRQLWTPHTHATPPRWNPPWRGEGAYLTKRFSPVH